MTVFTTVPPTTESLDVAVRELQAALRGQVIRPGDAGYDQARRVWNGQVDKYPALIVRCQTAQDVIQAVNFARRCDLPVAVRGGSHNSAGLALVDDGLVIDLSRMKGLSIDPEQRVARAEPGVSNGEFVQAAEAHGLMTTTGTCSGTGLTGATLGGGIGWLMGKLGLAIDNVLALELVTADGRLLTVNAHENTDLFWGLRGGGGNFGVVTAIELRLHPIGQVLAGMIIYPLAQGREALRFYRDFSSAAPDELTAYCTLMTLPDIGPALAVMVCYYGDLAKGERLVAPLRRFGQPLADLIRPMKYSELIAMLDVTAPDGRNYHDTAYALKQPGDDALDAILACAETSTSPFTAVIIQHVHGLATRVAPDQTAFALRDAHYIVVNSAAWEAGPAGAHVAWAEEALARMQPFASRGLYVNFMGQEGEAAIRDAYRANYDRLVALKNKYDPTNFFRRNHNIKPTVQAG